ncbi:MAG TPA: alpha-2-macroglobulin, partial [Anaerolineae bacterium]
KLYAGQQVDGGWGWWRGDGSDLFVSSYVVFGLAKAQKAGFAVDKTVLDRGVRFVRQGLAAPAGLENWRLNRQAFMVYALAVAGDNEPNRAGALFEARDRLSVYAQGYLALALAQINDDAAQDRIKTLLANLTGKAVVSATSAHWEESAIDYRNMNTDTRTTSIVLDVLSTLDPKNALGPNAVRWLMVARQGDRWQTTQENAWAIMALTDWLVSTGELQGNYDWRVTINGGQLGQGSVTPQTVDRATALRTDVGQLLLEGTNSLAIERSVSAGQTGKGQLYYTARLQSYLPVDKIEAQSRGITVSRVYQSAACAGDTAATDTAQTRKLAQNASCPAIDHAQAGDVINVKVNIVVPSSMYYLIVEDPLPAGLEAIDTSLRTTSQTAAGPSLKAAAQAKGSKGASSWQPPFWWWNPTHTDLRDEKTVMFATSLGPGSYEFNYQARATLAGQFLTLPPTAYEMYFPEVQGRGAGSIFIVTQP